MKKISLSFFILFALTLKAQTNYTIYPIPYNPDPFTVGNVVNNVISDDIYSSAISIGFSFNFYGVNYDSLLISTNGYVTFDLIYAGGFSPWSINGNLSDPTVGVSNAILAPWQDLNPALGGSIRYDTHGQAPYRRFVVSYYQIPMFSCTNDLFSQQIILFETTNRIETHILNKPLCASWNGGAAIHGLIDATGSNTAVVPGRDYPLQWTANLDAYLFSTNGNNPENNLIIGAVYQDLNNNCIKDSNELGIPNRPIITSTGSSYTYSNNFGEYSLYVDSGTYSITEMVPLYYAVACPSSGSYSVNFPALYDTVSNVNFADSVLFHCTDLTVDIGTTNMSRCLNEWVGITYCNNATEADTNAIVHFSLNDSISIINAPANIINLGNNNYSVAIGNINPGECGNISFQIHVGCDSIGTIYCMNASITGAYGYDCDTSNNQSEDCHSLIGSFDPNDLQVAAQNFNSEVFVTNDTISNNDELTYLIRFQNSGNDTAYNVKIKDMIPSQLDPASILMGAASHNYNSLVINGELIIDFLNIQLPDSATDPINSSGFVKFKIKQHSGNLPGTTIINQARIFFDANPPVITNQTFSTIPVPTSQQQLTKNQIGLMPNPVSDNLQIIFPFELKGKAIIEITDIVGKSIHKQYLNTNNSYIDCGNFSKGIYLATIVYQGSVYSNLKFVKN